MRLNAKIDKVVSASFCESYKELSKEMIDKLWDYYESLSESKPFIIDKVINELRELGDMEVKRWTLSSEMYYEYNKPFHYLALIIEFTNGFYCGFKPYYEVEGDCTYDTI